MTINAELIGLILSIVSLILSFVFWRLADVQARAAQQTLSQLKDSMLSWQSEMNRAAINLIEARPEVIAQRVSLEEAKTNAEFASRIASQIESLIADLDADSAGYKIAVVKELLDHQRNFVLGSEQIKAHAVASVRPSPPRSPTP